MRVALSLVVVVSTGCSFAPRESLVALPDGPPIGGDADTRPSDASAPDGASPDAPMIDGPLIDALVDAPMLSTPPMLTIGNAAPPCDSVATYGSNFASPTFSWMGSASDGGPLAYTCASGNGSAAPTPLPAGSACASGATFGPFAQGDHWIVITASDDMGSATSYVDAITVDASGPQITARLSCGDSSADASWSYTLIGTHCSAVSGQWAYYKAGGGGVPAGSGDALATASIAIPIRPTEFAVQITDLGMMMGGSVAVCE